MPYYSNGKMYYTSYHATIYYVTAAVLYSAMDQTALL